MSQITFLDLLSHEAKEDPATFAARLQERLKLTDIPGTGETWLVTMHDDSIAVLKDLALSRTVTKSHRLRTTRAYLRRILL